MPQTLIHQYGRASKSASTTSTSSAMKPSLGRATIFPSVVGGGLPYAGTGLGDTFRVKRYRKVRTDGLRGITKGDIRRLARRGGVKRIKLEIYETTREVLEKRVREIVKRTVAICTGNRRKTVTARDVVYALYTMGEELYGFGTHFTPCPDKRQKKKRILDEGLIAHHTAEIARLAEANRNGMMLASSGAHIANDISTPADPERA